MSKTKPNSLSRQQKAAITRMKNRTHVLRYVNGFMAGYLLARYDVNNGVNRTAKAVQRIAESSAE